MILFVDTSGWISLLDRDDKYHHIAAAAYRALAQTGVQFVTTDYVMDESLTHLLKLLGKQVTVQFGNWVFDSPHTELVTVDSSQWQLAWEMFCEFSDKRWSFTDCTSFVVMQQRGLRQAFAFDRHFTQAGFQLWPEGG